MGHSKSNPKREIHSIIDLPQESRKISNKRSNFTLKVTRSPGGVTQFDRALFKYAKIAGLIPGQGT